jgi:hypothetical protein
VDAGAVDAKQVLYYSANATGEHVRKSVLCHQLGFCATGAVHKQCDSCGWGGATVLTEELTLSKADADKVFKLVDLLELYVSTTLPNSALLTCLRGHVAQCGILELQ